MLAKLGKTLLYLVMTLVVLLAVAVGLLRIAMPQLPEHRDEIIARISEAIDGDISFDRLDARWRLRGPEIVFHDVVIGERIGDRTIEPLRIDLVTVGISVSKLIFSRALQIRRIGIKGSSLSLVHNDDGWYLQDTVLRAAGGDDGAVAEGLQLPVGRRIDVRLDDVVLTYENRRAGREPLGFRIDTAGLRLDGREIELNSSLRHDGAQRMRADVLLNGALASRDVSGLWGADLSVSADLEAMSADLLRSLLPASWGLPSGGTADLTVDAGFEAGTLQAAVLSVDANELVPPGGGDVSAVSGRLEWSRDDDGWLCAVSNFVVAVADRRWPAASLMVDFSSRADATDVNLSTANVTVYDLPYLASFLPAEAAAALLATDLSGTFASAEGLFSFAPDLELNELAADQLARYEFGARFEGLSVASTGALPGVRNLSGELRVSNDAGRIAIDAVDGALLVPGVFEKPLAFKLLSGTAVWRNNDRGISVLSDAVRLQTEILTADTSLELLMGSNGGGNTIDLQSSWSISDVAAIDDLLPTAVLSPKLAGWLASALESGRLDDGRFELRGDLSRFPFDEGDGVFRVSATAQDVVMRYARQWPGIEGLSADVTLEGMRLATNRNSGTSAGLSFDNVSASFDDLRNGVLSIRNTGVAPLAQLYAYAGASPIRDLLGRQFDNMRLTGDARYDIALTVPLKNLAEVAVDTRLSTRNGGFALTGLPAGLQDMEGSVRVDRSGVYAEQVRAQLLGEPVVIDVAPVSDETGYATRISGNGTLSAAGLSAALSLGLNDRIEGETEYSAVVLLPRVAADAPPTPVAITLNSDLQGLGIALPYPAGKTIEETATHSVSLRISDTLTARVEHTDMLDIAAVFKRTADGEPLQLDRATVHLGEGRALVSEVPGLFIDGGIDRLRLNDWLALGGGGNGFIGDRLTSVAVEVDDLFAFGQRVSGVQASVERSGDNWLVSVRSSAIEGTISVPLAFSGDTPVVLEMTRMKLLEADPQAGAAADPTALPPLRVRAAEFALGDREFGALDAEIGKVPDGVAASRLRTTAPAFSIDGSGDWLIDPVEASGSRSTLKATVSSTDVERMMTQLGYAPGINAESLTGQLDVSWSGGPSRDFLASLDGDVSLRIENGTLDEVEPGAGRMIGLMSVVELPRRLALDFRDVFQKGFSFDEIVGDFRLVNGDAYTCNLSLVGSSADVGLVGRASLDKRNYNQTAIVSVKVGNTLPAVGAVVAGPQVGAALLLFSQIFKKPLRGMTEVYYQINGSWDEPSIDRTDAARFVATSELAGCLVDNGG